MTSSQTFRDLLLIDLENLLGGSAATEDDVRLAVTLATATARSNHLAVIASGPTLFQATAWAWPGSARRLLGHGLDGADHALLRVLDEEAVEDRFDRLMLASGDGIFTASVARLAAAGLPTTVLARPSALARQLRLAASTVLALPEDLVAAAKVAC